MAGSRALEMIFDDLQPPLREEPPIDGQTPIVGGLARRALPLQVPHPDVVQPWHGAALDALETQVRIFIVAKYEVFAEATQLLEPGAINGYKGAGYRRDGARTRKLRGLGGSALAIVLHSAQALHDRLTACQGETCIGLKIHAAVHQRAVVVKQRNSEQAALLFQCRADGIWVLSGPPAGTR